VPSWSKEHFDTCKVLQEFEIVVSTHFDSKLHLKCSMFHELTVSVCYTKVCPITVLEERKASLK